ncbi:hypothetical protein BH11ACT8_BH11ACT8_07810 [soil metagenome]
MVVSADRTDPPSPERLTRNWSELLQELRVVQTGVQILTGFLLTVPFSSRFEDLAGSQKAVYLVVLSGSVLTTGFVVAPVAFHRLLFRHHMRGWLVEAANRSAVVGLALLALTSAGVVYLVFDVVWCTPAALVALGIALAFFAVVWVVVPRLAGAGRWLR